MPPKSTLWDRKGVFKDKKKRYGSIVRQQHSSSHCRFLEFKNQESIQFQRVGPKTPDGGCCGSGGGYRYRFPKEPSQGSCSGYDITFRSPRDPRRKLWEIDNKASLCLSSKRSLDNVQSTPSHARSVNNGEKPYAREQCHDNNNNKKKKNCERESSSLKRRIDNVLSTPSHACSVNTREKLDCREQCHDKNKNYVRESSLGWKPLNKGNNTSEMFYSRSTGKGKDKNVNIVETVANNVTEETRKRPRLNWGEGLAKFEKKKTEGDGVSAATPASCACSSFSGVGDTLRVKAETVDNDVCDLGGSPGPVSPKNHQLKFPLSSRRIDANSLNRLSSSIAELVHSDKPSSVDSSPEGFTAMTKLQIWKNVISQVLEQTETEICSLENELKPLQSESGDGMPCHNAKSCDKEIGGYDKVTRRPEPSQIAYSDDDSNIQKMMPFSTNLHGMHDTTKENDINSPGTATSKFLEAQPLIKMVSSLGGGSSFSSLMEIEDGMKAHTSADFYSGIDDDTLPNTIISSNRETAQSACAVFEKFLPNETGKIISNVGVNSSSLSHTDTFFKDKFAEKKRFTGFKEKALTITYKAFHHLWKKDLCLRYLRKCTRTSPNNHKLRLKAVTNCCQKNLSSIHYRCFPFHPAKNQISLVPTSEMINYTSQLLSKPQDEVNRKILKMPALILDQKDKMFSIFNSSNGLVEDPLAVERERAMINPWTSEERKIFSEKFASFGKDFRKIASFLDYKKTADCVEFYYKDHKPNCLEKDKKKKNKKKKGCKSQKSKTTKIVVKGSGKIGNCKANVDSHKKLSEAPAMARNAAVNRRTRSGRLLLWRKFDESERVAANALIDMCDSLSPEATRLPCQQPLTPKVTCRDIDDGTCEWTDEEKASFLQAVSTFGEDFRMIARRVGTKSKDQCKRFFIKGQKSHWLDLMRHRLENIGSLLNKINLGRSTDTNDARVVEADSVIGNDMSGTKTNYDQPSSAVNSSHDKSKPVETRNLSTDFNESVIGNDKSDTKTNDEQPSSATNSSHDKSKPVEAKNRLADLDEYKEINREFDHQDKNTASNTYNCDSKLVDTDSCAVVLYNSDNSSSVKDKRATTLPDIMEVGKDKVGDANIELVPSSSEITEPCLSHSVEDRLVSLMLTSFPTRLSDKDGKHVDDMDDDVVELKNESHDSNTKENTCLSSVVVSWSTLTFGAENQPKLFLKRSNYSGHSMEDPLLTANSMLQNTAGVAHVVQQETSATRDGLSLKEPVKKQLNADISCIGTVTEPNVLSQKIQQTDDHHKTQLPCSSGSEKTPVNRIVLKLFGKTITIPSSTQRPDSSEDAKHLIGGKDKKKEEE